MPGMVADDDPAVGQLCFKNRDFNAEGTGEGLGCDYIFGFAKEELMLRKHQERLIADFKGMCRVVGVDKAADTAFTQLTDAGEYFELVFEVKVALGFVHY